MTTTIEEELERDPDREMHVTEAIAWQIEAFHRMEVAQDPYIRWLVFSVSLLLRAELARWVEEETETKQ